MNKLPVKSKTFTNKLRASNPWGCGQELADLVDLNWHLLKLGGKPEEQEWLKDFAKRKNLAPWWVAKNIFDINP